MEENGSDTKSKTPTKAIERIALGKEEAEIVASWLSQLEANSKGFLNLSKSDVVNFLIREHGAELSIREMQRIRMRHYDPVRHLNWITPRLKEALQVGDLATVNSLQDEIRKIELSTVSGAKESPEAPLMNPKPKRRRTKKLESVESVDALSIKEIQADLPDA